MNHVNPSINSPTPNSRKNRTLTVSLSGNPATQPIFDFLARGSISPSLQQLHSQFRDSLIASGGVGTNTKVDFSNEGLRSEANSLRYELSTIKADRELERVWYQEKIRTLEAKAEENAKLADRAETDKRFLFDQQKALAEELAKMRDQAEHEKHSDERTIRQLRAQVAELQDTVNEHLEDLHTLERQYKRQVDEICTSNISLDSRMKLLQAEYDENVTSLQEAQRRSSTYEVEIENLRNDIVRFEGASGDLGSIQVLKRELSQQLVTVKMLETMNKKLTEEARRLREFGRNFEVLEEQKTSLESRLIMMEVLREELSEKELQLTILRNEKKAWSAFLEDNEGFLSGLNSPQEIAHALMGKRVENAELVERLGRVEPELAERDEIIERVEKEKEEVKNELEKVVESYKKLHTSRARIERNRQLALREVQMLRDQLTSYSTEESNLMSGNYDSQKTKQIEDLKSLIETYRRENETLLAEISNHETVSAVLPLDSLKRGHDAIASSSPSAQETTERLGQLTRRARHYQEEVTKLRKSEAVLRKELQAALSRISTLEYCTVARQRILELKDNPTARTEAIKLSQIRTLQVENAALMAQVHGRIGEVGRVVPASSLDAANHQLDELRQQVVEKDKRMVRLKQIWAQKSVEWRQAVHSIVGILFDFMPNGRVRVSCREWNSYDNNNTENDEDLTEEPGITFDGEQGTMKISPEGFSHRISPLVREWVEVRENIPGLIAALNMACHTEFVTGGMGELSI